MCLYIQDLWSVHCHRFHQIFAIVRIVRGCTRSKYSKYMHIQNSHMMCTWKFSVKNKSIFFAIVVVVAIISFDIFWFNEIRSVLKFSGNSFALCSFEKRKKNDSYFAFHMNIRTLYKLRHTRKYTHSYEIHAEACGYAPQNAKPDLNATMFFSDLMCVAMLPKYTHFVQRTNWRHADIGT